MKEQYLWAVMLNNYRLTIIATTMKDVIEVIQDNFVSTNYDNERCQRITELAIVQGQKIDFVAKENENASLS